jgi:sulfite dehydrogenase (cytochrome) subunit B
MMTLTLMGPTMRSIVIGAAVVLTFAAARAEEKPVRLLPGPGVEKVEAHCATCHSLDYIQMNSPFLSSTQWDAEVKKMINVMGAPINEADAKTIVEYLSARYGN